MAFLHNRMSISERSEEIRIGNFQRKFPNAWNIVDRIAERLANKEQKTIGVYVAGTLASSLIHFTSGW